MTLLSFLKSYRILAKMLRKESGVSSGGPSYKYKVTSHEAKKQSNQTKGCQVTITMEKIQNMSSENKVLFVYFNMSISPCKQKHVYFVRKRIKYALKMTISYVTPRVQGFGVFSPKPLTRGLMLFWHSGNSLPYQESGV